MSEKKEKVPKHRHLPSDIVETSDDLLLGMWRLKEDPSKPFLDSLRSLPDEFFPSTTDGWDKFEEDFIPETTQETVVATDHLIGTVIASSHSTTLVITSPHSTTTVIASTHSTQTVIASAHGQVTVIATDHSTIVSIATPHGTLTVIATAHGTSTSIQGSHTTSASLLKTKVPRSTRDSDSWPTTTSLPSPSWSTLGSGNNINHHTDGIVNHWLISIYFSRYSGGPSKIEWRFKVNGVRILQSGEDFFGSDSDCKIQLDFTSHDTFADPFSWTFEARRWGNAINVSGSIYIYQILTHVHGFSSQPWGHPVSTQPSGHPVSTQPSGHSVDTQPSGHPVTQQPSQHSVQTQPSGHPVSQQPSGHNVSVHPSGHSVETQPSGHDVTNPPHGHPLTGE